jgi:hypothetical protein
MMHLSTLFVFLGAYGALAAPVEQQALAENKHAQQRVENPYTPDHRDPNDKKVDSIGGKLDPLPWVSLLALHCLVELFEHASILIPLQLTMRCQTLTTLTSV